MKKYEAVIILNPNLSTKVEDFVKDFQIGQWIKFTPEWNIWWFYNRFYNYLKKPDM